MEKLLLGLASRRGTPVAVRYGATLVIVGIAFLLCLGMQEQMESYPLLLFIPAVFLAALIFDRGSGFLATVAGTLLTAYFFVPPYRNSAISFSAIVPLALFVLIGFTMSAVIEALRETVVKLARAEVEKSLRLEELAHRTKNDLMMISSVLALQARGQEEPLARAALESAVTRVGVIAQAQDRLRGDRDGGTVQLAEYIEGIGGLHGDLLRDVRPIAIVVQADRLEVTSSQAVSIGLIVNELVINALKYAFPDQENGTVAVSVKRTSSGVAINVADDGVGCPPASKHGLGTRLIGLLAGQMGGTVARTNSAVGYAVSVNIPLEIQPPGIYLAQ